MKIRVEDGGVVLTDVNSNDVNVVATDIQAKNGVVHVIDTVLLPPELLPASVVDIALGSDDFSLLVEAVVEADLVDTLSDPDGEFTVFAPTNAAFEAALSALGLDGVDDIPEDLLVQILTHHVVGAKVLAETVVGLTEAETLNGTVGVAVVDGGVVLTDELEMTANVVVTDVQAQNGVVHVIDKVLLPEEVGDLL